MRKPWKYYLLLVILPFVFLSGLFLDLTLAHDDAILRCSGNVKVTQAVKLSESIDSDNGLLSEMYDTDAQGPLDGKADILVQSHITGVTDENDLVPHRINPLFWYIDIDHDGREDIVYVDRYGEGRCEDIVLYFDLRNPSPDRGGGRAPYNSGSRITD